MSNNINRIVVTIGWTNYTNCIAEFSTYVEASTLSPRTEANLDMRKASWTDNGGFNQIGWEPEAAVYYSYSVEVGPTPGTPPYNHFTAQALSDIDGDATINVWGYVKPNTAGTAIAGTTAGAGNCPTGGTYDAQTTGTLLETVGPCAVNFGQSIF